MGAPAGQGEGGQEEVGGARVKIAVGISGGVDSAVAAMILKEQGHEVVGVTMTLGRDDEARSLAEAKAAAERLGVALHVFDLADDWKREVIDCIRSEYLAGRTPNPCVRCNERVKFGLLPRLAFDRLGCDRFATGHYARIAVEKSGGGGERMSESFARCSLLRAVDRAKDQSYFLYRVDPGILAKTVFPLGGMTKAEVREYARAHGLAVADKGDSQDFCGGDVKRFIDTTPREGNIVTVDGKVLGRHPGYWNYTVGMRRGLGIGGGTPYYVVRIDADRNEVVVGFREASVVHDLKLRDVVGRIDLSLPVKVRSAGEPRLLADGISGVAPGQSAVFYDGDRLVGGGIIASDPD